MSTIFKNLNKEIISKKMILCIKNMEIILKNIKYHQQQNLQVLRSL